MFEVRAFHQRAADGVRPLAVSVRPDGSLFVRFPDHPDGRFPHYPDGWELHVELAAALSDEIRQIVMLNAINKPDPGPDPRRVAQVLTVEAAKLTKVAKTLSGEKATVLGELAVRVAHASDVLYAFLDGKDLPQWDA